MMVNGIFTWGKQRYHTGNLISLFNGTICTMPLNEFGLFPEIYDYIRLKSQCHDQYFFRKDVAFLMFMCYTCIVVHHNTNFTFHTTLWSNSE